MGSRAGYLLRVEQARAARQAKPCESCAHPVGDHYNLPYELYEIDGTNVVVTRNPDYRQDEFHCNHEGCDCILRTS